MLEYLKAPFQEVDVLVEIAIRDALTLSQNPGFVHALGAALYRLRDADSALAARVGIDFISVREWAAQNLPLLSSAHKPYEGPLDFEYNITLYYENDRFRRVVLRRAHRLERAKIKYVNRRVKSAQIYTPSASAISVSGATPAIQFISTHGEPQYEELQTSDLAAGIRMLIETLDEAVRPDKDSPAPIIVTLQRALPPILKDQQVLACLADHGLTPQALTLET